MENGIKANVLLQFCLQRSGHKKTGGLCRLFFYA